MSQPIRPEAVVVILEYNLGALKLNLRDLSHDESVRQPAGAGNTINWLVGHMLRTRKTWLTVLGDEGPLTDDAELASALAAAPYGRGESLPADDPEGVALALETLHALFADTQPRLHAALRSLDDERLLEPAPFSPRRADDETLGGLCAGLAFHEAYHVGQTGILRRQLGHAGQIG